MNKVVIRGQAAEVRWAYHEAASLSTWTLAAEPVGGSLTATVVSHDAFRVSQQPLTFVVSRPNGSWMWPVESLQIADGQLTARLGPQKE